MASQLTQTNGVDVISGSVASEHAQRGLIGMIIVRLSAIIGNAGIFMQLLSVSN
jgi:hypothetical protein